MIRLRYILTTFVVIMILCGCVRRPSGVLSDNVMAGIVADMELSEAYLQIYSIDGDNESNRERMITGVLEKHGVSREEFDTTMAWYGRNVDAYYKLEDKVNRKLASRRRQVAKKAAKSGQTEEISPSSDYWPYSRHGIIMGNSGSDVISFSLPEVDIEPGSIIKWGARMRSDISTEMLLGVEYMDGMGTFVSRSNNNRGLLLTLQTDTAREIRRIFGNIALKNSKDSPMWVDSLMLNILPFDSMEYQNLRRQRLLKISNGQPEDTTKKKVKAARRVPDQK